MPEGKLLAVVLIAAALLFPAAAKSGREPVSDLAALVASPETRDFSPGPKSVANRGGQGSLGLSRPELLRLLAAVGTESNGPSQSRFVQLVLVLALATEGLPLLLRRLQ